MIEDPKLTLKILKYFASDEISWPANVDDRDLKNHFTDIPSDKVEYHLFCAIESGLLEGAFNRNATFDGAFYTFGRFDGLTVVGGEYVRNASSGNKWELVKEKLSTAGLEFTTRNAMLAMQNVIEELIKNP